MCSVDTCSDLVIEKKLNLCGALCRKCDSKKAKVVLQGKFPYCRDCFFIYFKHKYSSGLGKNKIVRPSDKILVAFSGSFSSICLLDLIHSSLIEDRKKKTIFEVVLVFIDEEFDRPLEERLNVFQCLTNVVSAYNYKLYFSQCTMEKDVILSEDPHTLVAENVTHIKSILQGFTSKSAKNDFIEILRTHVLYGVAKKLQCTKIFTAETSDHIASRIIGNIATGRGKMLATDTGFISNLDEEILLVRPLRECSKKEIVFYNVFNKLYHHFFPWNLEEDKFSSIQKLTELFISELQQSFPSTVMTISSTGSKIGGEGKTDERCRLCQSYLNEGKDFTAEEAMKISKLVTTYGPNNFDSTNFSTIENGSATSTPLSQSLQVCYACSILLNESRNKEDLLKPFVNNLEEVKRNEMYDDIKDFLI